MGLLSSAGSVEDVFERSLSEDESLRLFQVFDKALSGLCPCIVRKGNSCHSYESANTELKEVILFIQKSALTAVLPYCCKGAR